MADRDAQDHVDHASAPQRARARRRALGKERLRPEPGRRRRAASGSISRRRKRATRRWRRGSRATGPSAATAGRRSRSRSRSPRRWPRRRGPAGPFCVDCLTLWLSNLMFAGRDVEAEIARLAEVDRRARRARRSSSPTRSGSGSCRRRSSGANFATGRAAPIARSRGPATRSCSSPRACRRS